MQQSHARSSALAVARASGHLKHRFNKMRNCASHAAVAIAQEAAMGVERELAARGEIAVAGHCSGFTPLCQTDLLKQDAECDGKAIVDGGEFGVAGTGPARRLGARN